MKIIGLTGGIAAGKSRVSSILRELGAIIIDADIVAREIVQKGNKAWKRIKDEFGDEYLLEDGGINRKKLGSLVFSDKKSLEKLNHITHPEIKKEIQYSLENLEDKGYKGIVVIEAALLLEAGWDSMVDEIWVVDAPLECRIERIIARDGLSRDEAIRRINSQMVGEKRIEKAHRVIYNKSGIDDIKDQVQRIWREISH